MTVDRITKRIEEEGGGGGWTLFLDVFPVYKSPDKYVTSSDVVPDGLHASYKASGLSPYR
jgi:hypothetical protein